MGGMKIYFCGSISGGRDDAELYASIIDHLKDKYGTVLTEHVGRPNVMIDELSNPIENLEKHIHDRDMAWLMESDVVIAEVTQPSLGVGYELGRAVVMNKPILCLFRPDSGKRMSMIIHGAHNGDTVIVKQYKKEEMIQAVDDYMKRFQ